MISLIMSALSSSTNLLKGVSPLSVEWLVHFIVGGGREKTLPPSAIKDCRGGLAHSLQHHLRGWSKDATPVAKASVTQDWWGSLSGVVGWFEYQVVDMDEEGIHVHCWDRWDFNHHGDHRDYDLGLKGPRWFLAIVLILANWLGLQVRDENDKLIFSENNLSRLNAKHAFYTRWEDKIPWECIQLRAGLKSLLLRDKDNPSAPYYLLKEGILVPKWWEQSEALSRRGIWHPYEEKLADYWDQLESIWRNEWSPPPEENTSQVESSDLYTWDE